MYGFRYFLTEKNEEIGWYIAGEDKKYFFLLALEYVDESKRTLVGNLGLALFLTIRFFLYYVLMFSLQIEFLQLFLNITLHLESYREKQCFELLICNLINFKLVKSELQNQITKLYQSIWNLNPFLNPKLAGGGRRLTPPSPLVFLPYHSNF